MLFNPRRSLILLAVIVLASSSFPLYTSASPVARGLDLALHKRAPAPASASASASKVVRAESSSAAAHSSSSVRPKTAITSDHPSPSSAVSVSESSNPSAVPKSPASSISASFSAVSLLPSQASTNSPAGTSVNPILIGGIAGVAGIIVVAAGIFAVLHYRKQKPEKLSSNSNSFAVPGNVQSSSAISATPFPSNSPYERLDDSKPVGTFNVISTYTPTLGDELDIQPGDKVTVLVEYDDGWVQGINESRGRQKGVFPKHCVDYGQPFDDNQNSMLNGGDKRVKRISSMYGGAYGN